jgi:glutamate formiminotransferase
MEGTALDSTVECVVNVSEGRRLDVVDSLADAAGGDLLDVHSDPSHNRSVLTVVGERAPRDIASAAVETIDLREHDGVHPRFGVVDVVPFVALGDGGLDDAVAARDSFAAWAGAAMDVPCFLYGPDRPLPEVRRRAFRDLLPDTGPAHPHLTAGALAVGAREVMWLATDDVEVARAIAREVRGPAVRALGLAVAGHAQVSMNLVAPDVVRPSDVYDRVAARAPVARAELVGLVPGSVLDATPEDRWAELDLAADRTIEARLAARG